MKLSTDALLKCAEKAEQKKLLYTDTWQDCYDYALPNRTGFYDHAEGEERTQYIYDETAIHGVHEFASRMNQNMTPNFDIWFSLVPGVNIPPKQRPKIQGALDELTRIVGEVILNSNFATQSPEVYLDLALGFSSMLVNENKKSVVSFHTVPQPEIAWLSDSGNFVGKIFRNRKNVVVADLATIFPGEKFSKEITADLASNPEKKIDLVECSYRDTEDAFTPTWYWVVIDKAHKTIIAEKTYKGDGACPWITPRWSTVAGEVYGRGPLLNVLPAIRTCNLTTQLILQNAEMAIGGIWTADDDGSMNTDTIRLVPGTIIPIDPGSNGLRNVTPNSNFDVAQLVLQDMRDNIRRGLFNQNLGPLAQTPRSATEVAERQADTSEIMGANYGRLLYEFINPTITRVMYIMKKRGMIEMPKVDGKEVAIRAVGPMARMQKFEKVQRMDRFAAGMQQNQQLMMKVDWDAVAAYYRENYDVPASMILSPQAQAAIMQQAQQAMMQQQQQGQQQQK